MTLGISHHRKSMDAVPKKPTHAALTNGKGLPGPFHTLKEDCGRKCGQKNLDHHQPAELTELASHRTCLGLERRSRVRGEGRLGLCSVLASLLLFDPAPC